MPPNKASKSAGASAAAGPWAFLRTPLRFGAAAAASEEPLLRGGTLAVEGRRGFLLALVLVLHPMTTRRHAGRAFFVGGGLAGRASSDERCRGWTWPLLRAEAGAAAGAGAGAAAPAALRRRASAAAALLVAAPS